MNICGAEGFDRCGGGDRRLSDGEELQQRREKRERTELVSRERIAITFFFFKVAITFSY